MKKFSVLLSVLTMLLAVGGAFAIEYSSSPLIQGFEYIPAAGGSPAQCVEMQANCGTTNAQPCAKVNGHDIKDSNVIGSACGTILRKP